MSRLDRAINQKQAELQARAADLRDREYQGVEWARAEIDKLNDEIAVIQAYLEGKGELVLALCIAGLATCLIAHLTGDSTAVPGDHRAAGSATSTRW